jgi:hypothetical protein
MAEDYVRRLLPQNFPVSHQKIKSDHLLEMNNLCNDLCFDNLGEKLTKDENVCLQKCFNKTIEFDFYLYHEFERMVIQEPKNFNRRAGV